MKKIILIGGIISLVAFAENVYGQNGGANCSLAVPFCTNQGTVTQATNPGGTPSGGSCSCLSTTPNPQWYVLETSSSGTLSIGLSQTTQSGGTPIDIDFILLGPITNMSTACTSPCSLPVASCSYSASATETITANNVSPGQVFLLLVTNFNGQPSNISMVNNSNVSTNCVIGSANNGGPYCSGQTISLMGGLPIGANPANFTFSWTGPNGFTSNLQNPTIPNATAGNAGVYSYTLTSFSVSHTYTTTVVVNTRPTAALMVSPLLCQGQAATFDASGSVPIPGITSYQWIFNNSGVVNQTTTVPNTQFTYPVSGTYNAGVVVGVGACKDTAYAPVTVSPNPTASFTMAQQACENQPVLLNGSASTVAVPGILAEYRWDYDNDGTVDEVTTSAASQHAFPAGNYTVKLTVATNGGCFASTTKTIQVYPFPQANFEFNNACARGATEFTNLTTSSIPATITYIWDFGNGGYTSTETDPSIIYPGLGSYNVSLRASINNLCEDTLMQQVIISNDVTAGFSFNEPCGFTGIFTDQSIIPTGATGTINGWGWSFGDGGSSTEQNPTHDYTSNNIYNVTLIVSTIEGCFDTLTQGVPKYAIPVAAFSAANVCQDNPTLFVDSSNVSSGNIETWHWDFGDGKTSESAVPVNVYDLAGTYALSLIVVTENGCLDTAYSTTQVYPNPIAAFTTVPASNTTLLEPEVIFVEASTGATAWHWTIDGVGVSDIQNPVWTFEAIGTYIINLLVTNEFGCADEAKQEFIVMPAYNFFAPSAFTPFNGDALNEYWRIHTMGMKEVTLRIYNRWGEQLYSTQDPLFLWDGTYGGKRLPADVYVYKVDTRDMEGRQHQYFGTITILE